MFRLKIDKKTKNINNNRYKPPSFYIKKNIFIPPTYYIKHDSISSFILKEETILIILGYIEQIQELVKNMEETIVNLNQQQIDFINQNLKDSINLELRCYYDKNLIYTNEGAVVIARLKKIVAEITTLINEKVSILNDKFGNFFSYYDGDYNNAQSFADNLLIENQSLPFSNFDN